MTILASVNNKTVMPGITPIADVPDTPTIGTATTLGLAASVTFTAATTGGTATTFTATSTPGSLTGTSATSPITVSGLTEGTSYTFTVRANNSTGSSANSAASNSITAVSPIVGGYDSLGTFTVPTGGLAYATFAGIPTGYKHLQLRAYNVSATNNPNNSIVCRFNEDSGSNYSRHVLYAGRSTSGGTDSAAVESVANATNLEVGFTTDTLGPSVFITDILDYASSSKYKTLRSLGGADRNGSGYIMFSSGNWRSFSAISTITITHGAAANWGANSIFALYGVK